MRGHVGPVLTAGKVGEAVAAAIDSMNADVIVSDRGSYLRVTAPRRCVVTRRAIEEQLGRVFRLPMDLEEVMPSFQGKLSISEEEAEWMLPG